MQGGIGWDKPSIGVAEGYVSDREGDGVALGCWPSVFSHPKQVVECHVDEVCFCLSAGGRVSLEEEVLVLEQEVLGETDWYGQLGLGTGVLFAIPL